MGKMFGGGSSAPPSPLPAPVAAAQAKTFQKNGIEATPWIVKRRRRALSILGDSLGGDGSDGGAGAAAGDAAAAAADGSSGMSA